MNGLDYALIAIITLSVILAAVRGFVYELWMMAALVAAIALAGWKYAASAAWFRWLPLPLRPLASFTAIVIAVLLISMVAGRLVRGLVRASGLGWFDRLLGAVLGLVRGVVLAALAVMVLTAYPSQSRLLQNSRLAERLVWESRTLAQWMPADLAHRFAAGWKARVGAAVLKAGKELP